MATRLQGLEYGLGGVCSFPNLSHLGLEVGWWSPGCFFWPPPPCSQGQKWETDREEETVSSSPVCCLCLSSCLLLATDVICVVVALSGTHAWVPRGIPKRPPNCQFPEVGGTTSAQISSNPYRPGGGGGGSKPSPGLPWPTKFWHFPQGKTGYPSAALSLPWPLSSPLSPSQMGRGRQMPSWRMGCCSPQLEVTNESL